MKKKYLRLAIIIILSIAILFFLLRIINKQMLSQGQPAEGFDFIIPSDADFIESDESNLFKYDIEVIVNGIKGKTDQYTSLQVEVKIEPKNGQLFKKVYASIFLPKPYIDLMEVKAFTEFGLAVDDAVDISANESNASKGLIIQRATWIDNDYPDNIEEILKQDIKIKTCWKEGVEYSIFNGKNITIKYD
jgi:hypothetical protein